MTDTLFAFFIVLSLLLAVLSVTTPHLLRSVVYLMGVLVISAGLYLLIGAELLAGLQVLVYVGGIVVLLVIAVMLTQTEEITEDRAPTKKKILAALVSLAFFLVGAGTLIASPFKQDVVALKTDVSIAQIGLTFLDAGGRGYLLPFELISLLLLSVLIAGIVIARKENP